MLLNGLRYIFCVFARAVLWLRYRIEVDGLDEVRGVRGALVLPNHPAYIDPPLVLSALWPALRARPMAYAGTFRNPLLFWLPRLLEAVEVPDLEQHSAQAREAAERAIEAVVAGLNEGRNHILWPAGRVQRRDRESLGAARSLAEILRQAPEAEVVAVRTRGLRGSMFTFARTGAKPNLVRCLLKGAGILLANLLFFTPRRRVRITVRRIARSELPELTREKINPFFEAWYNEPGPENPEHIPYHLLFGRREFSFPPMLEAQEVDPSQIEEETAEAVAQIIAEKLERDLEPDERKPETALDALGLDSLDRMELSLTIESRFGFSSDQVPATVGDLYALAQGLAESAPPPPPPPAWFREPTGDRALELRADTIPEAFVRCALACRRDVALADDLSGAVTFERLLVGARVMGRRFARIEAPNVGLLLPASVAADLVLQALHQAGKLPVLMNWTTGPAYLAHAVRLMELTHVVTSRRFMDRAGLTLDGVECIYLEDLRGEIGRLELLGELLKVRLSPGSIIRDCPRPDPQAPAAVLFTSGSEKAPKAVPLTHENILSNLRSGLKTFDLSRDDTLLGFLPVFHSFGLTVTSLLPMLVGVRVVHHPDPTDARALAHKIAAYRPTLMCGTPTFVSYILDRARPEDLASLRLIVVGAEKCPEALFGRVSEMLPSATLLEGYGVSECAPLVAANRPESNRPGTIGRPLPDVRVQVVDPDSFEPLPAGEMGMLLVAGPNVFPGYIGYDGPSPFHEANGERWYVTGDLAIVDDDGFIHFKGRLKRFLKAGGEMISLPAIEEPLSRRFPPGDDGPRVAVEGIETQNGRRIVLFTTEDITLAQANAVLTEEGFRGIMRLDEVRQVDEIPLLGTGKTDYKQLRERITSGAE